MSNSNLKFSLMIDVEKAQKALLDIQHNITNIQETLGSKVTVDVDVSEAESSLEDIDEKTVTVDGDASGAVDSANDAQGAIEEVPDEKETKFVGDGQPLLQTMSQITLALGGLSMLYGKVKSALSGYVTASHVQEKAELSMINSMRVKGTATEDNIALVMKLASETQKLTTVGDEESMQLLTLATNMGITTEKMEEALQGSIGLATAFESAGLSRETAMKGIALAYEGEFTQLQRYIPALKSAGSETEKMAVLQEAMANGFELAKMETESSFGAMEQYQNLVGDLKEKVGDMLNLALTPLVNVMSQVVEFLNDYPGLFKSLIAGLGALTLAIGVLIVKQQAHNALLAITAALSGNWVGLAAAAVAGAGMWAVGNSILAGSQNKVNAEIQTGNDKLAIYIDSLKELNTESLKAEKNSNLEEIKNLNAEIAEAIEERKRMKEDNAKDRFIPGQNYKIRELIAERDAIVANNEEVEKELEVHLEAEKDLQEDYSQWQAEQAELAKLSEIKRLEVEIEKAKEKHDAIKVIDQKTLEEKQTMYNAILALEKSLESAKNTEGGGEDNSAEDAKVAQRLALEQQYGASSSEIAFNQAQQKLEIERDAEIRRAENTSNAEEKIATIRSEYNDKIIALIRERVQAERDAEITRATDMEANEDTITNIKATYKQKELEAVRAHNLELAQEARKRYALERQEEQDLWQFQQAQLAEEDPLQARYNAQLKAVENFFASKHDSLIRAGVSEEELVSAQAEAVKKIETNAYNARVKANMSALAQMGENLASTGKIGFEASKAINIAQVAVETPAAAFAAYRSLSSIPIVGPALGAVAFAAAIAQGAMTIKQITKTKPPKAEKGGLAGLLKGPSHADGGIPIEAEGDEYITNKKRVNELGVGFFDFLNFAPLSAVKDLLGGLSIPNISAPPSPSYAFASGGQVSGGNQFGELLSEIRFLRRDLQEKEMNVNVGINANDVISRADPVLLNQVNNKGEKIGSKF